MLKRWLALLACAAILLLPSAARAEETEPAEENGTVPLTLELPEDSADYAYRLGDAYVTTRVSFKAEETFTFTLGAPAQAVMLAWYSAPAEYVVTQQDAAGTTIGESLTVADGILNKLLDLDPACARVNILLNAPGSIATVTAYAADAALPDDLQRWEPSPAAADLLLVVAEPGMEWKQFGAVLPQYSMERGVKTAVLYVSDYGKRERAEEALCALWAAGVREYPIFAGFASNNYDSYKIVSGEWKKAGLTKYLAAEVAALAPKVIVTQGTEETSGAHRCTAESLLAALKKTPSVQKVYTLGQTEGKTITTLDMSAPLNAFAGRNAAEAAQAAFDIHVSQRLYGAAIDTGGVFSLAYTTVGEDAQKNDLLENIPTNTLLSYALATPAPTPTPEPTPTPSPTAEPTPTGIPALESAIEASPAETPDAPAAPFAAFGAGIVALGLGAAASVLLFLFAFKKIRRARGKGDAVCLCLLPLAVGLAVCAVFAGVRENDQKAAALEEARILAAATPEPTPTPDATPSPTPEPTPAPSEAPAATADESSYYRKEGDPAEVIEVDEENGRWAYRSDELGVDITRVTTTTADGKPLVYFVADIHMKNIYQFRPAFGAEGHTGRGAVYPWLIARRAKAVLWITGDNLINDEKELKGILIRDGRIFSDNNAEDTLAIYPDMSMRIFAKWETRAKILLEDGVENTFSFGPTLINDGVVNEQAKYHRIRRINPRVGIGYYAPGHYLAIVVDGRQKEYSVGLTVWDFAAIFEQYGCPLAYNLDGGLSAGMIFMGEQLNSHSGLRTGEKNDISYQRAVPDGLMFGYSEQVPSETDPILNNGNKPK